MNQHEITNAQWFAPRGFKNKHNVHFWARLDFAWAANKGAPSLKIAAESLYRLYLNGQLIGEGPARGTQALAFYDTHDLSAHLKNGDNRLEILVGCSNAATFKAVPERPALWCDLASDAEHIEYSILVSNADEFDSAAPLYTLQIGYTERRDLRVTSREWGAPEFFELSKTLLPRDIQPLEVTTHRPLESETLKTAPSELGAGEWCIFDFGRIITGGARVQIEAHDGDEIEFGYEEIVENGALRVWQPHEGMSGGGYLFIDRFLCRDGVQTLGPTLEERGFRYLQVRVVSARASVRVLDVEAIDRRHPLPPLQNEESDPFRRRLLDMAHHTVSSCATDVLTDCPWREATFWVNDFVVNALFWMAAGGDTRLVERCLRLAISERNVDGLAYCVCPSSGRNLPVTAARESDIMRQSSDAGADRERLVFLSTNTFLPLVVADLRDYGGDWQPFIAPLGEIMHALRPFEDADGLLISPSRFWNFLDWGHVFSGHDIGARASASQSLFYVLALDAMAEMSGDSSWQIRADRVLDAVQKRFWNEERGHFREFDGEETAMHLAQSLAILTGRCDEQRESLLESLIDETLVRPELYMMHFVLRALTENGRETNAQALIERFWKPIVDSDSVSIWEANVHQHGKNNCGNSGSLCHAFSCAPLLWLSPLESKLTAVTS